MPSSSAHVCCSKSYSILSQSRQSLWRRIWWVLFINDVHHAAVFGRPPHIHSHYVDVPALTVNDMTALNSTNRPPAEWECFLVEHCRLAILLDKCLLGKFATSSSLQTRSNALLALKTFTATHFTNASHAPGKMSIEKGFYPALLNLVHLDYLIVVERMLSSTQNATAPTGMESYFNSAGSICRILEDLLSSPSNLVMRLPYVGFPAIFCSILIHIIYLRRETGSVRLLAEHRARLAMIIADQLQDRWPFVVWTRHLLDVLLKNTDHSSEQPSSAYARDDHRQTRPPVDRALPNDSALGPEPLSHEVQPETLSARHTRDSASEHEGLSASRNRVTFSPGVDGMLSPIPFMFPWNSLLEDVAELDQWLL